MTIIIRHDQSSVDPGAMYDDERFEEVISSLESEYEKAIKREFPEAEVEFERSDNSPSVVVAGVDEDPCDVEDEVQRICERVYETGLFWI